MTATSYFERTSPSSYRATAHTSGAWNETEQHIAPAIGLLVHLVEVDRDARRDDGLRLGRLSYDIHGTVPVGEMDHAVEVLRPGRTIELVEARLTYDGRTIVTLRAWLLEPRGTDHIAASPLPAIPGPEATPAWDSLDVWSGGMIASLETRRSQLDPGRASGWLRSDVDLVDDARASTLAHMAGLFDVANGMTVRADPREVLFPNVDLTAHLFRYPRAGWLGLDTAVNFGPEGIGLTHSILHDEDGVFGTLDQCLTVRPI